MNTELYRDFIDRKADEIITDLGGTITPAPSNAELYRDFLNRKADDVITALNGSITPAPAGVELYRDFLNRKFDDVIAGIGGYIPPVSFPTVSGAVCSFDSQYAGLPLKSHTVDIDSVSGVSAIHIGSDNKYAGFINFNQLLSQTKLISSTSVNGIDVTNNGDGSFTLDGTANTLFNLKLTTAITVPRKSHPVLIRFNTLPTNVTLFVSGYGSESGFNSSYFFYETDGTDWTNGIFSLTIPLGKVFDHFRLWITYYDLTVMFGETKADEIYSQGENGIEYFNSLFPNDYYDYNAGTLTTVSAVNGSTNSFFTIPIGQTVNEGEYNARTGILEVTSPSVQTIQLPPCPIDTLEGVNNIWADTGDTTLQYIKIGGNT